MNQTELNLQELQKRLSNGQTDREIIAALNIPRTTFYSYKKRLYNQYGRIAEKKTEQIIELEAELLKDRYLKLYRNLEDRIIKADSAESLQEIASAAEIAALLATNIFRLEVEGLRSRQTRLELKYAESKAVRYLGLTPTEQEQGIADDIQLSDITATSLNSRDTETDTQTDFGA